MALPERTRELVERYGGKAGVLLAIQEKGINIPTPNFNLIEPGKWIRRKYFFSKNTEYILRGSHPDDYYGMVDIFPTFRDKDTGFKINPPFWARKELIRKIRRTYQDRERKTFCENNQQGTLDKRITVMLQEEIPARFTGSLLRHPHHQDEIIINYYDFENRFNSYGIKTKEILEINGWKIKKFKKTFFQITEFYEELERADILDPEDVNQVEFVIDWRNNPYVVQARAFKKRENPQNFKLEPQSKNHVIIRHNSEIGGKYVHLFGITPGIELEYCYVYPGILENEGVRNNMEFVPPNEKYCLNLDESPDELLIHRGVNRSRTIGGLKDISYSMNFSNMKAFILMKPDPLYLAHDHYRLIKMAGVSILGNVDIPDIGYKDKIRIACNGNEALIEKLN